MPVKKQSRKIGSSISFNYILSTTPTANEIRNIPKPKEEKIAKALVEYFKGVKK